MSLGLLASYLFQVRNCTVSTGPSDFTGLEMLGPNPQIAGLRAVDFLTPGYLSAHSPKSQAFYNWSGLLVMGQDILLDAFRIVVSPLRF